MTIRILIIYNVEEEYNGIKDKADDVEDKALFCPLLLVVQLNQTDNVFEIVLH
jgi:hypothetical protein